MNMELIITLIIVLILGICAMWLLVLGSRNEYDDPQSDEDQVKYLNEWRKTHSRR